MTKVLLCGCKHAYQDARYGKGRRVHNSLKPRKEFQEWRCTVCTTVRQG